MDATVFVREPNTSKYSKLGVIKFSVPPRIDEYISAEWEGETKYFQVIAFHHATAKGGSSVEVYAVRGEPVWQVKDGRAIGFGAGK